MALPSRNENFALVVLEALALGTPVLVSDQVGLSDFVQKNRLGWVTTVDTEDLRQNLQTAIDQAAERERIQQEAPVQVRRKFDPGRLAQQYLEAFSCLK